MKATSLGMDCYCSMLLIYIGAISQRKRSHFASKQNGLRPNFGTIRSMLYRVSAACLTCCTIFK